MRELAEECPVGRHSLFPLALQSELNGLFDQLLAQPDFFFRMKLRLGHPQWPSSNVLRYRASRLLLANSSSPMFQNQAVGCLFSIYDYVQGTQELRPRSRWSCHYTATAQPCKDQAV